MLSSGQDRQNAKLVEEEEESAGSGRTETTAGRQSREQRLESLESKGNLAQPSWGIERVIESAKLAQRAINKTRLVRYGFVQVQRCS